MNLSVKNDKALCRRELGPCVNCEDKQCMRYQKKEWYEGNRYAPLGMDDMASDCEENEAAQSYVCQPAGAGFTRQG